MEAAIGVVALLFVLFVAVGVVVTVKVVRAVGRGVERTGVQVRRTVEETSLKARSAQPGPVGEAARTRLELRAAIDNTRAALEARVADDPSLQESLELLDRLHEHARQLDGELRVLMEREPDRARMARQLPQARERVERIRQSADSLRHAAQDRARQHDEEGLDALRSQIEVESGALRHWENAAQEPTAPPATGPVESAPSAAQQPAAEAAPEPEERKSLPGDARSAQAPQQDPRKGFSQHSEGRWRST